MASISPTSRTLNYLRQQGWVVDKVEQFNPYAGKFGKRKDLFGFADLLAIGEGSIIAIQSCGTNFAEHHKTITQDADVVPNVALWLDAGGRLLLIGWRKVKMVRGGKAMRYEPRIREYILASNLEIKWFDK